MTTHVMRPVQPLRAYALSAILSIVGAIVVVLGKIGGSIWIVSLGALILSGGLVLLGATVNSVRRYKVSVDLDEEGYAIHSASGDHSGRWADVTRVTRTADGTQLTLHHDQDRRTLLVGRDVTQLEGDMARYLDKSRGYGVLPR